MKLDDLNRVNNLHRERQRLLSMRDDGRFEASVSTVYGTDRLDPIMITLIRPTIVAELDMRIGVVEDSLRDLGVVID